MLTRRPIVIYDACVLYPAPLRDLLMHLALTDLFQAKWTNEIHNEWIRNVLQKRPDLNEKQLLRTKSLMNENIRDCIVTDYDHLISTIELPDHNDRHVLAAAIKCSANIILTYNLKDFPNASLKSTNLKALHPDTFIATLILAHPEITCTAIQKLRKSLKNPPKNQMEYLQILTKQSLIKTVELLDRYTLEI